MPKAAVPTKFYIHADDIEDNPTSEAELLKDIESGDFGVDIGDKIAVYELKEVVVYKHALVKASKK
jgi:hypothetical protein